MLIFDHEVDRRDMRKTKEKNVVYVGFSLLLGRFLDINQSDLLILLKLIIKSLIDFAFVFPSSYVDHYLNVIGALCKFPATPIRCLVNNPLYAVD